MNEWKCQYCKRVNDFEHKTCDGCGACKEFQDRYGKYDIKIGGFVTTQYEGLIGTSNTGRSWILE